MERQVTVVVRASFKKVSEEYNVIPGDIVCIVKGSTGNVYTTTLRRNKQHTCTCPANVLAGHMCYHIQYARTLENARYAAENEYVMSDALHAKLASIATAEQEITTTEESQTPFESETVQPVESNPEVVGVLNGQPQSAEMPAWLAILPSRQQKKVEVHVVERQAQIEQAKKEIILENEIACRLKILKNEKMEGLKKIALSRNLTVASRKKADYIQAIIADIRNDLEAEMGIAA